ncbi:hypothetical protein K474DRAFT_1585190 [Panus rudis PR-1116 ss-1]|nr:hypothetical protein K474DRAFT_1585190 [Panus rudis PR-1116 ss-1]
MRKAEEETDTLPARPFKRQRTGYIDHNPSVGKVARYEPKQRSNLREPYSGLSDHVPPTLLDETLCQLRYNLETITPAPADSRCFYRFRAAATENFPHEEDRRRMLSMILYEGGITPGLVTRNFIEPTLNYDDGDLRVLLSSHPIEVIYYIQQPKLQPSPNSSDPYSKAFHYWLENVRYVLAETDARDIQSDVINFPVVFLLHYGTHIAIAAAVYGCRPSTEILGVIPLLHVHPTNISQLNAGARPFAALRVALHALRARYSNILTERRTRSDFPFRDFYVDDDGKKHSLTYREEIEDKRIYCATDEDGNALCVKFSVRYSEEAHRFAHSAGFAPKLYAVNKVYDWFMVVMEDKSAEYPKTLWDIKQKVQMEQRRRRNQILRPTRDLHSMEQAQAEVKKILRLVTLHNGGFVHGDIRDVNVLVRKEGAPGEGPAILVVDWDWAGTMGKAVYPFSMNPDIKRPPGAATSAPIEAAHDDWMANNLLYMSEDD